MLDELHTYDGAQGADVACLIRRLKERLEIPKGELCVVGTSATLDDREERDSCQRGSYQLPVREEMAPEAGNWKLPAGNWKLPAGNSSLDAKETGSDRLAKFASTLFEEEIDAEAVIGEDRLTIEEIIAADPQEVTLPNPIGGHPLDDEDALRYALRQGKRPPVYPGRHVDIPNSGQIFRIIRNILGESADSPATTRRPPRLGHAGDRVVQFHKKPPPTSGRGRLLPR